MSPNAEPQNTLTLPPNIGRTIVKEGALITCPLLATEKFIKFCKDRGLLLNRERLIRLERLGLFAPVYRVRTPKQAQERFVIPPTKNNDWFKKGWAWDTTSVQDSHAIPALEDRTQEGYYSIFQIGHLDFILNEMTLPVSMDGFLEISETRDIDWNKSGEQWMKIFRDKASILRDHEYRRSQALLCQFISNRYYPHTQGDQRTIQTPYLNSYFDEWVILRLNLINWDWNKYARNWKPYQTERLFQLTPEKLRHAYKGLAIAQESCDPMARWYKLVQFISVSERRRLKGDALKAETLRAGAHMLRLLHKDLYGEDLPHPNEVTGTVINHVPELEVRRDTRRYLEFVANRYGINPQPKVCLIVEGPSEESATLKIFENRFRAHPGKFGIEIIPLGGVDKATGGKKDKFRAILRLIDYLHHHQTSTFLILDNEGYAKRLEAEAKKRKSIHGRDRYVTRPEHIKIWDKSFELDNFSPKEIATALTTMAQGEIRFSYQQVTICIRNKDNPNRNLEELYERKTGRGLQHKELAEKLVDEMLAKKTPRDIDNRPIVKTLDEVAELAMLNPFPVTLDLWERNQVSGYLAKKWIKLSARSSNSRTQRP